MPRTTHRFLWLSLLAHAGCGNPSSPATDAAIHVDAAPPPRGATRAIYFNFDGVTLTGGPQDDATLDRAVVVKGTVAIPPFLAGAGDRDATIDAVVAKLHTYLDMYDVEIVRTRPASGTYSMVVFGGRGSLIGVPDGGYGISSSDCRDKNPSNISLVFDDANTIAAATNSALFDVGTDVGLGGTSGPMGNCMCVANCGSTDFCSFSTQAIVSRPCQGETVQNQIDYLKGTLGIRL